MNDKKIIALSIKQGNKFPVIRPEVIRPVLGTFDYIAIRIDGIVFTIAKKNLPQPDAIPIFPTQSIASLPLSAPPNSVEHTSNEIASPKEASSQAPPTNGSPALPHVPEEATWDLFTVRILEPAAPPKNIEGAYHIEHRAARKRYVSWGNKARLFQTDSTTIRLTVKCSAFNYVPQLLAVARLYEFQSQRDIPKGFGDNKTKLDQIQTLLTPNLDGSFTGEFKSIRFRITSYNKGTKKNNPTHRPQFIQLALKFFISPVESIEAPHSIHAQFVSPSFLSLARKHLKDKNGI